MAKAARSPRAGTSYVTTATRDRQPLFETSRIADLFIETLLHYRTLGHYKLHAYVVMPDHVHLLLTPQNISLDQAVGLIKNAFAYRLNVELPVLDEKYTGYSVANLHDLEIVRAHLHQVPVRAGLVDAAELYPHYSAHHQTTAVVLPPSRPPASVPAESEQREAKDA